MSRTYRRLGKTHARRCLCPLNTDDLDTGDVEYWQASNPEHCLGKKRAWFHRDHPSGRFGIPRWYRRERNRHQKRKHWKEWRRHWDEQSWEAYSPTPYKRDGGWWWWY